MMSDFRKGWGSEMNPKNWILEGKNWRLGGMVGGLKSSKSSDIIYGRSLAEIHGMPQF